MTHNDTNAGLTNTPTPRMSQQDLNTMAVILESRHGALAKEMADFFASVHAQLGDAEKCWAWGGVASIVEKRAKIRLAA